MTETTKKKYPTDGESYAHGATYEWTETYDREDIIEALVKVLRDDLYSIVQKLCTIQMGSCERLFLLLLDLFLDLLGTFSPFLDCPIRD